MKMKLRSNQRKDVTTLLRISRDSQMPYVCDLFDHDKAKDISMLEAFNLF